MDPAPFRAPVPHHNPGGSPRALDAPTLRRIGRRALVLWILVRVGLVLILLFAAGAGGAEMRAPAGTGAGSLLLSLVPFGGPLSPMTWALAGATGVLLCVDVRATRETTLLAHLGIGQRHVLAVGAAVAAAFETAAFLTVTLARVL